MWSQDRSWAEQLEDRWTRGTFERGQPFDGVFTAISLRCTGTGALVTDPLSIAMLYRAETADFVAYSSASQLAARVTAPEGREPARDPLGVAWLPFLAYLIGDRTGFVDVRTLPSGATVELSPAYGSRVRTSGTSPWAATELPSSETELIDLVHADLLASIRSVARLPARRLVADITGGRDTRLAVALMLEEGVTDSFEFRTTGVEHSPDSVVARSITERFGLHHEPTVPGSMSETDFRERMRTHVFQTSGMLNIFPFKGMLDVAGVARVTGMPGELMRSHHKGWPTFATIEELVERYDQHERLDSLGILRPEVREVLHAEFVAELTGRIDAGGSAPADHLDSFYVHNRLRRWFGTVEALGESGRIFPLYSLVGLQAAFTIGSRRRWAEWLPFEIMRRAAPDLAKMPLANQGWSDQLLAPLQDAGDYRQPPVVYRGTKPVSWQRNRVDTHRDVVEDVLLDEASSPWFDFLDRAAIERVLSGPTPTGRQQPQALFGALAAAVWLGGAELPHRIGGGPDQPDPLRPKPPVGPVPIARPATDASDPTGAREYPEQSEHPEESNQSGDSSRPEQAASPRRAGAVARLRRRVPPRLWQLGSRSRRAVQRFRPTRRGGL